MARPARAVAPEFPHRAGWPLGEDAFIVGVPGTPYLIVEISRNPCHYLPMARVARAVAPRFPHRTGRPLGEDAFIEELEFSLHGRLKREKTGPGKKDKEVPRNLK